MDYELLSTIAQNKAAAASALAGFLQGYTWDAFYTATFKYPAKYPRLALDRMRTVFDASKYRTFCAAEPHYLGNYHTHGLVWYDPRKIDPSYVLADYTLVDAKTHLNRLGFNSLSLVRRRDACSTYCSKYLTKSLCDWEFWGDWSCPGSSKNGEWVLTTKKEGV